MSETHPTINPALPEIYSELDALCKLIREEKVILWVGSGFSSYADYPTGTQLPSIMLTSLGELPEDAPKPGSALLQDAADYYVKKRDRSGLNSFLIEQYGKEPSRYNVHESLALINRIKYIVTTNYDPLFERAYGDKIAVVSHDEDLPGSTDYPDKSVLLKIHGDISQPEYIVITSDDYQKFDSDTIVWNKIRTLLAEYTVVFIGYSLHDTNVEKMLGDIYSRLRGKKHPYFFISRNIDETKRKDLAHYDLHFIEMNATDAIDYITNNAIQYAYLDSRENPALFSKSDQIFDNRGFRVDRSFTGVKVTHVSVVPMRPGADLTFNLSITSKSREESAVQAFQNFVAGRSLEPVKLTDEECDIEIHGGVINGVFIFDPLMRNLREILITPQPFETIPVDLKLQNHPIRLSNLPMKVFKTASLLKLEIQDPDFIFTIRIPKSPHIGKINVSLHHIIRDIERARVICSFFDNWIKGDTIELLTDKLPAPFLIHSSPVSERKPNDLSFGQLLQFYTDLSDIQNILGVKLSISSDISPEECKTIQGLADFIRGRNWIISKLPTTIENNELLRNIIFKNEPGIFRLAGNLWEEVKLLGKVLKIPFVIEGTDVIALNTEEVLSEIERGDLELHITWKSETGMFYKKFEKSTTMNSDFSSDDKSEHVL